MKSVNWVEVLDLANWSGALEKLLQKFEISPSESSESSRASVREHYVGAYHILTFSISLPPSMVYERLLVVSKHSLVLHPCASLGRYHILYLLSLSYLLSRPRVLGDLTTALDTRQVEQATAVKPLKLKGTVVKPLVSRVG